MYIRIYVYMYIYISLYTYIHMKKLFLVSHLDISCVGDTVFFNVCLKNGFQKDPKET